LTQALFKNDELPIRAGHISRRSALCALAVPAMIPLACSRSDVATQEVATATPVVGSPMKELPRDLRPFPPVTEPLVRIKVADVGQPEVEFGKAGARLWITAPGTDVPGRACRGPVRLRRTSTGWSARWTSGGRGGTATFKTPGSIALATMDRKNPGIEFEGRRLLGTIHVEPIRDTEGRTEYDVVCHLPMESYLPGVVGKELYPSWRPATFEAQAIAARSFAVCERAFWIRRRHYDLVAGQASQAWSGGEASTRATSAVRATTGQLLVWRGQVVPAYYSAACGGLRANAEDAISKNPVNGIPPLRATAASGRPACGCVESSPHGDWTVTISRNAFEAEVAEFGRRKSDRRLSQLRRPLRLEVHDRNQAGRPVDFELVGAGGAAPVLMSAESIRRIVATASTGDSWSSRPRSACFEVDTTRDSMKIRGRGFGHGVGLCQYGAEEMASRGASSLQILERYYPGAEVQQAWSRREPAASGGRV
jgi:stage II sporulation protein D